MVNQVQLNELIQKVADLVEGDMGYRLRAERIAADIVELVIERLQGPATVNEIHAALIEGNYQFETKDADNAKRGLRVSLTKNNVTFHKLPDGKFGLLEWYPAVKPSRRRETEDVTESESGDDQKKTATSEAGKGG